MRSVIGWNKEEQAWGITYYREWPGTKYEFYPLPEEVCRDIEDDYLREKPEFYQKNVEKAEASLAEAMKNKNWQACIRLEKEVERAKEEAKRRG